MSSRRKIVGIVLCIVFAFLLLGCVIAFLVARSVFTDAPIARTPLSELDPAAWRMAQMKTAAAVSRIRHAKQETPPQELTLSRAEFEALTETLLNLSGQIAGDTRIGGIRLQDTALNHSPYHCFEATKSIILLFTNGDVIIAVFWYLFG